MPGDVEQLVLRRRAAVSRLAEARRDDDEGTQAGIGGLLDNAENLRRRHSDDAEVHRWRQLADRGIGVDTTDRTSVWVHRVDGAGEVAGEQRPDDFVADPTRAAAGTDHCDRARSEERGDARRRGDALALLAAGKVRGRRREIEPHPDDALDKPARFAHPGVLEHPEHLQVLRQRLG